MRLFTGLFLSLITGFALAATSPNGTVVLAGSTNTITSADGTVWSLSAATVNPAAGVQVVRNGKTDVHTAHIVQIAYVNGVIWQDGAGTWRSLPYPSATYWATDNLNPLTTLCAAPPAPSATLSWTPATKFADGTSIPSSIPVTYNIYQGTSATALTKVLTGLTTLSTTISAGLSPGHTYYWATTGDAAGHEGAQSNIVSKSL